MSSYLYINVNVHIEIYIYTYIHINIEINKYIHMNTYRYIHVFISFKPDDVRAHHSNSRRELTSATRRRSGLAAWPWPAERSAGAGGNYVITGFSGRTSRRLCMCVNHCITCVVFCTTDANLVHVLQRSHVAYRCPAVSVISVPYAGWSGSDIPRCWAKTAC